MKRLAAMAFFTAFQVQAQAPSTPEKAPPPAGPETRWFNLERTSTGYVAGGNLANTFWAFHLRGAEMKRLAVTTFSLNGVIVQVRAIPRSIIKGGSGMNALGAHKAYEQEHLSAETKGVTFRDHEYCRDAKAPYQQWISQAPGGISQAFVTFIVGDYILMVGSPFENTVRENAVARALGEVCATFRAEKNTG